MWNVCKTQINFYLCLGPVPKILYYVYINIPTPGKVCKLKHPQFQVFVHIFLSSRQGLTSHADLECPRWTCTTGPPVFTSNCWDNRHVPPHLLYVVRGIKPRTSCMLSSTVPAKRPQSWSQVFLIGEILPAMISTNSEWTIRHVNRNCAWCHTHESPPLGMQSQRTVT